MKKLLFACLFLTNVALAEPAPVNGLKVGLNLSQVAMSSNLILYADLMKQAGPWMGNPAFGAYTFDTNGWPVFGAAGVSGRQAYTYVRLPATIAGNVRGVPCTPPGTYTLVYTANATTSVFLQDTGQAFSLKPVSTLLRSDGRVQQTYTGTWNANPTYAGGFMCVINASAAGPAPTDIRIYAPGVDPNNATEFWAPGIKQLSIAASLRDVVTHDLNGIKEYSDFAPETARSYGVVEGRSGVAGMPFTSFCRLIKTLGCAAHITFPYQGSEDLAKRMGMDCASITQAIRFEFHDEPWNGFGPGANPQFVHLQAIGQAGPAYPNGTPGDVLSGYCTASNQFATVFEAGLGRPAIRVLNCQADNTGTTLEYMMFCAGQGFRIDEFTIGGYEDTDIADSPTIPAKGPYSSDTVIVAVNASIGKGAAKLKLHRAQIDSFSADGKTFPYRGKPISCYESGIDVPHLTQLNYPGAADITRENQCRENLSVFVHPAYYDANLAWLATLDQLGVTITHVYADGYVQAEESGRWPMYQVWLFPGQDAAVNDGTGGFADVRLSLVASAADVAAGSLIAQPDLSTCGSPRAAAIAWWNSVPPPVVDPVAAAKAQAMTAIEAAIDAMIAEIKK